MLPASRAVGPSVAQNCAYFESCWIVAQLLSNSSSRSALWCHTISWLSRLWLVCPLCICQSLGLLLFFMCLQGLDLECSGEHRCCLDILLRLSLFICCSSHTHITLLLGLIFCPTHTTVQVYIPGCGKTHFTLRPTFGTTVKGLQCGDVSCALVRTLLGRASKFGHTVLF